MATNEKGPFTPEGFLSKETLNNLFDRVSVASGRGSVSQSFYDQISGLNMLNTPPTLPNVRERAGLTFWTRPNLNLSDSNLRAWPPFYDAIADVNATPPMMSYLSVVRSLLDPRGCWSPIDGGNNRLSPLIDNLSPFIPWLSNSLISMSGWPEILAGTFTSSEGNHHEAYTILDDTIKNYRVWDLSSSHRNPEGNLIGILLYMWVAAASLTFEGDMVPYPDSIRNRRRNYMSRIFRFATDDRMHRIEEWWSTIAYPYMAPTAVNANFSIDSPFNTEAQQVSINWKCTACETYDPRVLVDFNRISVYFNPYLHPNIREQYMVKVDQSQWQRFNYKCYLYIDTNLKVFERWVPIKVYNEVMESLSSRIFTPQFVRPTPAPGQDLSNDQQAIV